MSPYRRRETCGRKTLTPVVTEISTPRPLQLLEERPPPRRTQGQTSGSWRVTLKVPPFSAWKRRMMKSSFLFDLCSASADVQDEETERDEEEDQEAALPHRDAVTQNPPEAEVMVAPTRGFLQPRVEEEEEQEVSPLTAGSSPSFTEPSRDWLETTTSSPESEVRGSRASEVTGFDELEERQVGGEEVSVTTHL